MLEIVREPESNLHNVREIALSEPEERHGHHRIPGIPHSRRSLAHSSKRRCVHQVQHCAIHPVSLLQQPPTPRRPKLPPHTRATSSPPTCTIKTHTTTVARDSLARRYSHPIIAQRTVPYAHPPTKMGCNRVRVRYRQAPPRTWQTTLLKAGQEATSRGGGGCTTSHSPHRCKGRGACHNRAPACPTHQLHSDGKDHLNTAYDSTPRPTTLEMLMLMPMLMYHFQRPGNNTLNAAPNLLGLLPF